MYFAASSLHSPFVDTRFPCQPCTKRKSWASQVIKDRQLWNLKCCELWRTLILKQDSPCLNMRKTIMIDPLEYCVNLEERKFKISLTLKQGCPCLAEKVQCWGKTPWITGVFLESLYLDKGERETIIKTSDVRLWSIRESCRGLRDNLKAVEPC